MRIMTLLIVVVGAAVATAAEGDKPAREELTGVWKGGVDQGATGHVLTFTAERITGQRDDQDLGAGEFKLELTKKPLQLDATRTKGAQTGKQYLGIYQIEGDTLKWCVSTPGNERPTEFATKGKQFLLILKRQK